MKVFIEQTDQHAPAWDQIDWGRVERNVRRLQERIYRATERQDWKTVRSLQKLLARSTSNQLLAIRRVTQENKGKHTPGVDGKVYLTGAARMRLFQQGLDLRGYRPQPVRRTYIPKGDDGTDQRPLGIPTVRDRVMQTIVKTSLEPEWEARFEANSYGYRPGRCPMDAIVQLHVTLCREGSSEWILDADIRACFDNLAHEPLLARVPVFKTVIQRWLKAGVVELRHYQPTEVGAPQGGSISPLLCNIALDGMERLFGAESQKGKPLMPSRRQGRNRGISLIRFADDLVATAPSREVIETYVLPRLTVFLAQRGLEINAAKTRIVHRDEGFNFLGFTIRRYNGTLLTQPQKEKVQRHCRRIKAIIDANRQASQENLIRQLNPVIRGWANYYRHGASKQTFNRVNAYLFHALWRWAKRRHPNKPRRWIAQRYFQTVGSRKWVFGNGSATLCNPADTRVTRFVKVKGKSSPYDPKLRDYWAARRRRRLAGETISRRKRTVLTAQDYRCTWCGILFLPEDNIHLHHRIPQEQGGPDTVENLQAVHQPCHAQLHARCTASVLKA